jgi:hypothetical protein
MDDDSSSYLTFSAREYLDLYYNIIGSEGEGLLNFLTTTFSNLPDNLHILEFGGGPTVISLMCVAHKAAAITFCDYVAENRAVVERWLAGDESDFDWSPYIERTLQLEGIANPTRQQIQHRAQLIRERVKAVLPCDIYQSPPAALDQQFDVIICNYTLDAVTGEKTEWHTHIRNLCQLLAPGGVFILASLREADSTYLGGVRYPNVYLQEQDVVEAMRVVGFPADSIRVASADADHAARDYTGVIFSSAVDNRA